MLRALLFQSLLFTSLLAASESLERYLDVAAICNGRLTLTSGTGLTTSDVTAATAIYFTPYKGAKVSLYDGVRWKLFDFSEVSLALGTLSSGYNYDVFLYDNAGTPALALSAAWNVDGLTRTDALALQNGIYVKSGSTTHRLVGTIRTTSTTTTEDSRAQRFVWNACQQEPRTLFGSISTVSWSWNQGSYRATGGNSTNGQGRIAWVQGLAAAARGKTTNVCDTSANYSATNGLGMDTTPTADLSLNRTTYSSYSARVNLDASWAGYVAAGYHLLQSLEFCVGAGATAIICYGTGAGGPFHSISGEILG